MSNQLSDDGPKVAHTFGALQVAELPSSNYLIHQIINWMDNGIPLLASTTQRARCHNLRHPNQGKAETIAMSSNMHALIVAPRAIVNPMAPDHESRSQRKHVTCEHDDLYDDVVGACNTYGYPIAFGAPGYPWIEISHSLR